jgi:divalent metal cation (Fe/Co/Zn/Cd) transporter
MLANCPLMSILLLFYAEATLVEAHHIADELEKLITQRSAMANVVIHVDPYDVTKEAKGSGGS